MAKFGLVQNGLKSKSNGIKKKSNPLTLARVKGFLKSKNGAGLGVKLVSKSAANPKLAANPKKKKHHKKKNGGLTSGFSLRRNGLLGNTTKQVKDVGALLGGMLGGKMVARFLQQWVAPYLASTGLGKYAEVLSDGAVALLIAPFVANKIAGGDAAKFASLGAMANVVVDVIEMVAPNSLSFFGGNALVSSNGNVGLSPAAVTAIVNSTSALPADKAKVAGAMAALESGTPIQNFVGSPNAAAMMPLYD